MNQHNIHCISSTLTRDSLLYTSSAAPGELSKLIQDTVVVYDSEKNLYFVPPPDFIFRPYNPASIAPSIVPFPALPSSKYRLRRELSIGISAEENEIKAEIPDLELYAFADTEEEAIAELVQDFLDLCDNLLDVPDDRLGKFPQQWKHFLESIIELNA